MSVPSEDEQAETAGDPAADDTAASGERADDDRSDTEPAKPASTETDDAAGEPTRTTTHRPGDDVVHPDAAERNFGRRGDVLLVTIFLALIVMPVVVYLRPPALPWRVRLLIFPLLPGLVMAAVAVWATTRP